MKKRILHILIALDQLIYVLLTLGKGYPDMTISAAAYRSSKSGNRLGQILHKFIDILFWPIEEDHCLESFLSEVRGKHLPPDIR